MRTAGLMRVFIGIALPEPVRAAAAAASAQLRVLLKRRTPRIDLRWVESSNLHVTLWFIGEVTDERCNTIRESLQKTWSTPSFQMEIGGSGMFPPSGPPRVLWLGLRHGGESLRALYAELKDRLVALGFEAERRPYSAHLTVARVKTCGRADGVTARKCLAEFATGVGSGTIDHLTLFQSRLSPRGARYEPLLHVPLK